MTDAVRNYRSIMSDFIGIDGPALDRHITGNYGEDQFQGSIECSECEGSGQVSDTEGCPRCSGEGRIDEEHLMDPGDDPDRKYDEERDRRLLDE